MTCHGGCDMEQKCLVVLEEEVSISFFSHNLELLLGFYLLLKSHKNLKYYVYLSFSCHVYGNMVYYWKRPYSHLYRFRNMAGRTI